jgi:hypothetical protein
LATFYRLDFPDRQYQYTPAFGKRARSESTCTPIHPITLDAHMSALFKPIPEDDFLEIQACFSLSTTY